MAAFSNTYYSKISYNFLIFVILISFCLSNLNIPTMTVKASDGKSEKNPTLDVSDNRLSNSPTHFYLRKSRMVLQSSKLNSLSSDKSLLIEDSSSQGNNNINPNRKDGLANHNLESSNILSQPPWTIIGPVGTAPDPGCQNKGNTFTYTWDGTSGGYMMWKSGVTGKWQCTDHHIYFNTTGLQGTQPEIEVCGSGGMPALNWDATGVANPAAGSYLSSQRKIGDWWCTKGRQDMRYTSNLKVGHMWAWEGRNHCNVNDCPQAYYEWTYWIRSINGFILPEPKPLFNRMNLSSCQTANGDPRECPLKTYSDDQPFVGDPIKTRFGNFDFSNVDLSIDTIAGPLNFQRTYASQATGVYTSTSTLGYGWTHNQDTRLIFSSGVVWFKAHTANQYKFFDLGNKVYSTYPGVLVILSYDSQSNTYTIKTSSQSIYTFNSSGQLIQWRNSLGYGFDYSYASGRLDRVTEPISGYYLSYSYQNGRISTVSDHSGRQVSFTYDANNDLTSYVDVMGKTWAYVYSDHRMTYIKDNSTPSKTVLKLNYDNYGRAIEEFNGLNQRIIKLEYKLDMSTWVTDSLGLATKYTYNTNNVNTKQSGALGNHSKTYDSNFRPLSNTDALTNTTQFTWSADGANLLRLTDANNYQTNMTYDSHNNLTSLSNTVSGEIVTTTYEYSGSLLIRSSDPLGNSTLYTYTSASDAPQPSGLLKAVRDPNNHLTTYIYNENGQRVTFTDALNRTTNYSYDSLGRQKAITYPDGRQDWTCYDAKNRVVRLVTNATGDGSSPLTDPCDSTNYVPVQDGEYDRISTTVYNDYGDLIATIDPNGRITRSYFDAAHRLTFTVDNLGPAWGIYTAAPPPLSQRTAELNLTTLNTYDSAGKIIAVTTSIVEGTTPISQTVRTYYDSKNRPEYEVRNLTNWSISQTTPPPVGLRTADQNVTTRTYYDFAGNAIAIEDPLGRITRAYYDNLNRPYLEVQNLVGTSITDPNPPTCNRESGAEENLCSEKNYDEGGNLIATKDPKGVITRTYYDVLSRPFLVLQNLTSQSIEEPIPPDSSTFANDHNVASQTTYDASGNAIASIEYWKNNTQLESRVTRTYYDAFNRPTLVVRNLDPGYSIQNPVPPACNRDITGSIAPNNICVETLYDPDSGNSIASIDPLQRITRSYYDSLGRTVMSVRNLTTQLPEGENPPQNSTFANDHNVTFQTIYDGKENAIASVEWSLKNGEVISRTTRTFYDSLNRSVSVVHNFKGDIYSSTPPSHDPTFPDRNVRTDTIYASDGNLIAEVEWFGNSSGQLVSRITRIYYDGLRRSKKVIQNLDPAWGYANSNPPTCNRDTTGFSNLYNVCNETIYRADDSVSSKKDALGNTTTYSYDGVGRLESVTNPLPNTTLYDYDVNGNQISMTDARGNTTLYEYDSLNRMTGVIENYRSGITPDNETNVHSQYSYDAQGNRLSILNGNNQSITFTYDALGRLSSEQDALGHTWQHSYDVNGNQVRMVDANGQTTLYTYDGLDRLVVTDYSAPDSDVSFEYNALGWRTSMIDGIGTTLWQYNNLGEPITITHPISGVVSYRYNSLGNRTHLIYADGKQVSYDYDMLGRLSKVTDWNSGEITYTYDVNGNLLSTYLPNTVVTTKSYDAAGQVTSITNTSGSLPQSSYTYQYDPIGNRSAVTETIYTISRAFIPNIMQSEEGESLQAMPSIESEETQPQMLDAYPAPTPEPYPTPSEGNSSLVDQLLGLLDRLMGWFKPSFAAAKEANSPHKSELDAETYLTITYTYDPLNRVTAADYSDNTYYHYTYDSVGNRLTQTTAITITNYLYDNANRLSNVNGIAYTWDANGNLLSDGVNAYTYDLANRLTAFSDGTNTYTYTYNGLGDRLQQTTNNETTTYAVDIAGGLTQVLSDGANTYLYPSTGSGRISQQHDSATEYYLADALGSVRQLTDSNGEVVLVRAYDPYGNLVENNAHDGVTTAYGYTGEFTDASGMVYLRARYYSPTQGRFVSRDVWEGIYNQPSTLNRWIYVNNSPVNIVDPSGYSPIGYTYISMCVSAITVPPNGRWLGMTAGQAVAICHMAYNKDAWNFSEDYVETILPTSAFNLFIWYVNEFGDDHLNFDGSQPLTKELATSVSIQILRKKYYQAGNLNKELYKFNGKEVIESLLVDTRSSWLPITQYLGSFWYQVKKTSNGRVGFRIDNDSTLESGTHIAGRFPEEGYQGSVEELIYNNPSLANQPLEKVIKENRVISIISSQTRNDTNDPNGGGTMYQTFTWTEISDQCLPYFMYFSLPTSVLEQFLDIKPWYGFESVTEQVFP